MLNRQVMGAILLLLVGFASYFILKPFILAIVSAAIFAILFRPIFDWLHIRIKSPNTCAVIVSVVASLLVIIPLLFVSQAVYIEMTAIVKEIGTQNVSSSFVSDVVVSLSKFAANNIPGLGVLSAQTVASDILSSITTIAKDQLFSIPNKLLFAFLGVFVFYYMLRDGHKLVFWIYSGLPITQKNQQLIDTRLKTMTYAVVYGQIVTAIIQGLISMFGYWLFGLHSPVLWGLATMLFSLVPFIGTAMVWLPASIFLFFNGLATDTWWSGIGLLVYGIVVVSIVDNVLRPFLIGASSRMHHAVAFVGVIGGVFTLGFIGVFAGPLILALFVSLYEVLVLKGEN